MYRRSHALGPMLLVSIFVLFLTVQVVRQKLWPSCSYAANQLELMNEQIQQGKVQDDEALRHWEIQVQQSCQRK